MEEGAMSHHKRGRPKHQRAGCLLCKPHKDEREAKKARAGNRRRELATQADLDEGQ